MGGAGPMGMVPGKTTASGVPFYG